LESNNDLTLEGRHNALVKSPSNRMKRFSLLRYLLLCPTGNHILPAKREPFGPITAECPCCGKMFYCYSLDIHTRGVYMSLVIPNYPRVLGTIASLSRGLHSTHGDHVHDFYSPDPQY